MSSELASRLRVLISSVASPLSALRQPGSADSVGHSCAGGKGRAKQDSKQLMPGRKLYDRNRLERAARRAG